MTADLRILVDRALEERLSERGFTKGVDGVFLRKLGRDISAWIGIGLASRERGGEVDADPMVGVRYEPVERLLPSSAPYDATVFRPLYELRPGSGYRTWSFNGDNVDEQADALVESLEKMANPFMESLASPSAIEQALGTWAFADVRRKRLPALRLAQGDEAGARAELDREKSMLAEDSDPATLEEYDAFAAELLASGPM